MSRVNKIMVIQCKKRETVKFKLIKFYSILITDGLSAVPWHTQELKYLLYTLRKEHIQELKYLLYI